MIVAQSAATSRVFAVRRHERVDENADILGLATANAATGVSGAFVVNGSPTQTAMADSAGARSQVAQLVFAGVVLLVLLFLTGPLQYLPRCVLASIVFTVAVGKQARSRRRRRFADACKIVESPRRKAVHSQTRRTIFTSPVCLRRLPCMSPSTKAPEGLGATVVATRRFIL
jgi:hypothetical protein